jgi:autotransporter-associated beta strand protein
MSNFKDVSNNYDLFLGNLMKYRMRKYTLLLLTLFLILPFSNLLAQRQMEKLNRGLVAVRTSTSSVFLSWRVLGSDPDNIAFNLYRDGVKITPTPITINSNYTDATTTGTTYTVKPVLNGVETGESNSASIWSSYLNVSLSVPSNMSMPDGSLCTYSPNDCSVGDVDGDGEYEIVVKWDPSNAQDNSNGGYTGNVYFDVMKLNGTRLCRIDLGKNIRAGAHYTQFQVGDYDGDGKAEIVCKTAPGTKDGEGNYLSRGPAASDDDAADYRNTSGYILTGPEYLTVFNGKTGLEMATVNYVPARGTVSSWGDNYGNRVDRFLACTAYLDGLHPSIVMCRGYYTRAVLAAWDYKNGTLTQRWVYDSNSPVGPSAAGQGNHNLSVGDVDNDGKDEIIYGASAFDDNGKCMYVTGLGHGDAMHLSDLNPDRKGLEVWEVHEDGNIRSSEMHDAKTGDILWYYPTEGADVGRGLTADIAPATRGYECWSSVTDGFYSCTGTHLSTNVPSYNFVINWDADLSTELLDRTSITDYVNGTLLSASDCSSCNGTKATPNLSADIFGDWREEVIFHTTDNTKLRIYTTTIPTNNKLYTLMHDAVYRNSIAWQNSAYNQPPYTGFYLGEGMDEQPVSAMYDNEKRWKAGTSWDNDVSASFTDSLGVASTFKNGDKVLFDISTGASASASITGDLTPKRVKINSPYSVFLSGTGSLNGDMDLKKIGSGSLTFNNTNNYTGATTIWEGNFFNNGFLTNSDVTTLSFVKIAGKGIYGGNVTLGFSNALNPGPAGSSTSKITFLKGLKETGSVTYTFDMIVNGTAVSNDTLVVGGEWTLFGKSLLNLNITGGTLPAGNYLLANIGNLTGELSKIRILGIPTNMSYGLSYENGSVMLKVAKPSKLTWNGNVNAQWDISKSSNWLNADLPQQFLSNDTVFFTDVATSKSVTTNDSIFSSNITVDAATNYTFNGSGTISGPASLLKTGAGTLTQYAMGTFTGKTFINGGTLEVDQLANGGVPSKIGASDKASANIVINGGTLNYTGNTASTDRGLTLGPNDATLSVFKAETTLSVNGQLTGTGALIKDGSGQLSLSVTNDYKGGTVIKAGTLNLTTDEANSFGLSNTDTITIQGGTLCMFDSNTTANTSLWNLKIPAGNPSNLKTDGMSTISGTLTGSGTLNYYTPSTGNVLSSDASTYAGTLNVTTDANGGYFVVNNPLGFPQAKINLNDQDTMLYKTSSYATIPLGELNGSTLSVLGAGGTGVCKIIWEVGNRNSSPIFAGKITNNQLSGTGAVAALKKVGTGTLTLTNASTYTGGTTINGGILKVNNTTGSGLGTGIVIINSGGILAGTGFISGAVTVNEGGTLSPGGGIGTLTLNSTVSVLPGATLLIDIDKTRPKTDILNLTGSMTMAGKLQLNPLNGTTYAVGDSFKIITGTVIGIPSEIIPAVPGNGLAWDLTQFASNGVLKVGLGAGLSDSKLQNTVYPNPFKNDLHMQFGQHVAEAQVSVVSLTGSVLYLNSFKNTDQTDLKLETLQKGVYLLQVKVGDRITIQKIVKE